MDLPACGVTSTAPMCSTAALTSMSAGISKTPCGRIPAANNNPG